MKKFKNTLQIGVQNIADRGREVHSAPLKKMIRQILVMQAEGRENVSREEEVGRRSLPNNQSTRRSSILAQHSGSALDQRADPSAVDPTGLLE